MGETSRNGKNACYGDTNAPTPSSKGQRTFFACDKNGQRIYKGGKFLAVVSGVRLDTVREKNLFCAA